MYGYRFLHTSALFMQVCELYLESRNRSFQLRQRDSDDTDTCTTLTFALSYSPLKPPFLVKRSCSKTKLDSNGWRLPGKPLCGRRQVLEQDTPVRDTLAASSCSIERSPPLGAQNRRSLTQLSVESTPAIHR